MDENMPNGLPSQIPPVEDKKQIAMSRGLLYFLVASIVVLFVALFVVIFLLFFKVDNSKIVNNSSGQTSNSDNQANNSVDFFVKYDSVEDGRKDYTASLGNQKIEIDWYGGARVLNEDQKVLVKKLEDRIILPQYAENDMFVVIDEDMESIKKVYGFVAGEVKSPSSLAGRPLYLLAKKYIEMGSGYIDIFALYDEKINDFIFITSENEIQCSSLDVCQNFVVYDLYKELLPKAVLDIPGEDSKLVFSEFLKDEESDGFSNKGFSNNRGGVLNVEKNKFSSISEGSSVFFEDKDMGSVYKVGDVYEVILPDGSIAKYGYIPYFFASSVFESIKTFYTFQSKLDVSWLRGSDNNDEFSPSGDFVIMCGQTISAFPNVVNDKEWFSEDNLEVVGTTKTGEKIFTLTNVNDNKYYKEIFDWGYGGYLFGEEKDFTSMTDQEKWQDFVSDMPLVFWENPEGKWMAFRKTKYQTLAECGKPVIYLYPERETDVRVQVEPKGGLSISDPDYGTNGWFVRATPESKIFNYNNKTEYPYLFWEGYSYDYTRPCYGFVMSRENVASRMSEILAKLGMNEKESADFMEFWEEKLTVKPYVFVTFLPQATFEEMAPLTIDPKPDTVIRVFMDYQALDYPLYNVSEPYLQTPERKGFTVVEWGGRLY